MLNNANKYKVMTFTHGYFSLIITISKENKHEIKIIYHEKEKKAGIYNES